MGTAEPGCDMATFLFMDNQNDGQQGDISNEPPQGILFNPMSALAWCVKEQSSKI
jgi:hypothetical protein